MAAIEIHKFGGGILRKSDDIERLPLVLQTIKASHSIVVISALGKTTNRLENLFEKRMYKLEWGRIFNRCKSFHLNLIDKLGFASTDPVRQKIALAFRNLEEYEPLFFNDAAYAKTVAHGEMFASIIVHAYLEKCGVPCSFLQAPHFMCTDNRYREATVDLEITKAQCALWIENFLKSKKSAKFPSVIVTQGFIGSVDGNIVDITTLGREGSDYTAGVLGVVIKATKLTNAISVTLWKNVPGVMSRDPTVYPDAFLLPDLTYDDARAIVAGGSKIIHHKTLDVMWSSRIPLTVRSFYDVHNPGTCIGRPNSLFVRQSKNTD